MRANTLWESFVYAWEGFSYALRTQRNFRIHCLAVLVLVVAVLGLDFSVLEVVLLFGAAFLVLITELVNTAVEKTIDLYTTRIHPLARVAKNCAAAAVMLSALYSLLVGLLILLPKLFWWR